MKTFKAKGESQIKLFGYFAEKGRSFDPTLGI